MRAGDLDRLITIQLETGAQDSAGGATGSWTDFAVDVPANVRPLGGRDRFIGDQLTAENISIFTIRWRQNAVTEKMRILYNAGSGVKNYLVIGTPDEIGRREWVEIRGEITEEN